MVESIISLMIAHEVMNQNIALSESLIKYQSQIASVDENKIKYNITFDISTKGSIKADVGEFSSLVESILTDARGWKRAGVKFIKVPRGGKMHVVLASGVEIGKYNGCSAELSCTYFPLVFINDERWRKATDSYNSKGLSLKSYRQLVVNHEVGHYLGHGHVTACGVGGVAPVMLQQSTGLRGCIASSWPLDSELWVTRGY